MRGLIRTTCILPAFAAIAFATPHLFAQGTTPKKAAAPRQDPASSKGNPAPVAEPDPARMRAILKDWETISTKLKTLEVDIRRVDTSDAWGTEEFIGQAKLMSPNFAYLNFDKVDLDPETHKAILEHKFCKTVVDPKTGKKALDHKDCKKTDPKTKQVTELHDRCKTIVDAKGKKFLDHKDCIRSKAHERIVCTGTEVWQYVVDTTQIFIFPLGKEDQQRALDEGPLPFLFNMQAEKAEARYSMRLLEEKDGFLIIGVLPKEKIDKAAFSQAFIRLNRKTYFPDNILLITTDGQGKRLFTLSNARANEKIDPRYFKGIILPQWTVVRDPGNNAEAQAPRVGAAGGAGAQPKGNAGAGNRPR